MPSYKCVIEGVGRNNQSYLTTSYVEIEAAGHFPDVAKIALSNSFHQLTEGRAEYGNLGTCMGPYKIKKMTVELIE